MDILVRELGGKAPAEPLGPNRGAAVALVDAAFRRGRTITTLFSNCKVSSSKPKLQYQCLFVSQDWICIIRPDRRCDIVGRPESNRLGRCRRVYGSGSYEDARVSNEKVWNVVTSPNGIYHGSQGVVTHAGCSHEVKSRFCSQRRVVKLGGSRLAQDVGGAVHTEVQNATGIL